MEVVRDTLCQSGIEGMKWGVRNGPPYPLRPSDHSSAEIKANPSLKKKIASGVSKVISKTVSTAKTVHERRRLNTKNPKRLTDSELRSRIQRLKSEEEFRQLQGIKTKQQSREQKLAAGKAFAVAFMTKLGGRVGSIGTTVNQKIAKKVLKERKPLFGAEAEEEKRLKYSKKLEAKKAESEFNKYTNEEKDRREREKAQRKEEKNAKKYSDVDKVIKSWEASNELTNITNSINDIISDVRDVKYEDLVR